MKITEMTYQDWGRFWDKVIAVVAWTVFFPVMLLITIRKWWKQMMREQRSRQGWGPWF